MSLDVDTTAEGVIERRPIKLEGHWSWHVPVHMSQGWVLDDLVLVGGQIAVDEQGEVIGPGDIEIQTREVFANIGKVLAEAGLGWEHVVKLNTFYVCEPDEDVVAFWEKMTRVRMEFLRAPGPAATAVRVVGLMYPELVIEAEAMAIRPR
ncbi:MAG: 2-iminobutanoate/2-iminopropanoate deaminase [Thermoleophilaceae bacterium]|jgi:enamine deaminase RidA (YjgF/YER057c/UK114 family)|nr:2-iminobutanoate/2-iminopropanoate deaminase [Thermoleophilaceae bacterium]